MQFFTATILQWKHLMRRDDFKQIVVDSLRWLNKEKGTSIYGFVVMPNHVHILWRSSEKQTTVEEENALLRFTAHQFLKRLKTDAPHELLEYLSTQNDRQYQFWERNSKTIELAGEKMVIQKLDYIHNNPLQHHWQLVKYPADYFYSSAAFYENNDSTFDFLTHYKD